MLLAGEFSLGLGRKGFGEGPGLEFLFLTLPVVSIAVPFLGYLIGS